MLPEYKKKAKEIVEQNSNITELAQRVSTNETDINTVKPQIEKNKNDISGLKGQSIAQGYNFDSPKNSHTYKLSALQCYLVVTAEIGNYNASNLAAWIVATGGGESNTGIVTRIAGSTFNCSLNGLTLTVNHAYYSTVNIRRI